MICKYHQLKASIGQINKIHNMKNIKNLGVSSLKRYLKCKIENQVGADSK